MKAKLLKKIRKKYQIRRNLNGKEVLFERFLFWWIKYEPDFSTLCSIIINNKLYGAPKNVYEYLIIVLTIQYGEYRVKHKNKQAKENTWIKIWYNANS